MAGMVFFSVSMSLDGFVAPAAVGEDAPVPTPVFVVTPERRDSWPRPGGTADASGDHLTYAVRGR